MTLKFDLPTMTAFSSVRSMKGRTRRRAKNRRNGGDWAIQEHYVRRVRSNVTHAAWLLRVTDHKDKPSAVLIVKERILPVTEDGVGSASLIPEAKLEDRGLIYGAPLRRCLPIFHTIVGHVADDAASPSSWGATWQGQGSTSGGTSRWTMKQAPSWRSSSSCASGSKSWIGWS